jgi:D-alanyl-lipoteichoic acid acyltransferase DltB (MBOAT superfamily)
VWCFGMQRIIWGLFKKLVIADKIALFINPVFADTTQYTGWYLILASVTFAIQLYADFSGFMDIVIGAGEMFDIKMTENFKSPYFHSKTIQEHWQRWHITLGVWLKDYIFFPIMKSTSLQYLTDVVRNIFGKKVAKKFSLYIALIIMWFCVGLWHGASWNFVIGVGLLHCTYIILEDLLAPIPEFLHINNNVIWTFWQRVRTFVLVCLSFVFFRAKTVPDALKIFKGFTNKNNFSILYDGSLNKFIPFAEWIPLLISICVLFIGDALQQRFVVREAIAGKRRAVRWFLYMALMYWITIFGVYGPKYEAFIYQGF